MIWEMGFDILHYVVIVHMSVSVPAPAPVSAPSCWTEQSTVWETQYVDTVTQECRPVTKQECSPVTKVKNHWPLR